MAADWKAMLRLPVDRRLTSDSIQQAWKAVSVEAHPDRCHAPGAEDAFMRAGEARDALACCPRRGSRRGGEARGGEGGQGRCS
jgi:curved DNA-binding protein CbpA